MSSESSDSTTPTLPLPIILYPVGCGECVVKMSGTPKNPGRLFYYCLGDHESHGFVKWCEEADRGLLWVTEAVNILTETMSRLTDRVGVQRKILEAINNRTVELEHDIILHRQVLPLCAFLISIQLVIILGQT